MPCGREAGDLRALARRTGRRCGAPAAKGRREVHGEAWREVAGGVHARRCCGVGAPGFWRQLAESYRILR